MLAASPLWAENRIDGQSPDAPALSAYGDYKVGVRQLEFLNPDQVDILAVAGGATGEPRPRYDRPLTVEMWYPAADDAAGETTLKTFLRDGTTAIELEGQAVRDAASAETSEAFPLVLLSHGYPGNRFLLSHLAENLASKGYVVASIDHTDSTYNDISAFGSTLVNRPLDQLFVLEEMAKLNADATSEFAGKIDASNTGLVGYSMGGYGALITAGAGVSAAAVGFPFGGPDGTLAIHQQGSDTHENLPDPRIKTAIAIGPWGNNFGVWEAEGLAGIEIPMLFMAGAEDTVSGYENGVRPIWEGAVNADRALLTFEEAGHNAAAPIPAPSESFYFNPNLNFNISEHYTTPGWDTVFMNNVAQHFATAWLDDALKGDPDAADYLNLSALGSNDDWLGFQSGTSDRLRFEVLTADVSAVPLPASSWLLLAGVAGLFAMKRRSVA